MITDGCFRLQVQFVLTMFQTSCAVVWPCGFPMGWLYFQITYMITLILLFSNFYIKVNKFSAYRILSYESTAWKFQNVPLFAPQTYKSHAGSRKSGLSNGSINSHTNGVTSNEKVKYRKPRTDWWPFTYSLVIVISAVEELHVCLSSHHATAISSLKDSSHYCTLQPHVIHIESKN